MKLKTTITMAFLLTLAAGVLLWPAFGSQAQDQQGCEDFQAIAQAWLPTSTPLTPDDTWGGPLFGVLGGNIFLGVLSGNDGNGVWHAHVGSGKGGAYTVCVGYPTCTDSFTYEVPNAVYPVPPGQAGFMKYSGNTAKIKSGTGRFQSAFGNLNVSGPAVAWEDSASSFGVSGRWNVSLSGKVCGIH
jgi:hypothetical protein